VSIGGGYNLWFVNESEISDIRLIRLDGGFLRNYPFGIRLKCVCGGVGCVWRWLGRRTGSHGAEITLKGKNKCRTIARSAQGAPNLGRQASARPPDLAIKPLTIEFVEQRMVHSNNAI
jgi:hypothetical protein